MGIAGARSKNRWSDASYRMDRDAGGGRLAGLADVPERASGRECTRRRNSCLNAAIVRARCSTSHIVGNLSSGGLQREYARPRERGYRATVLLCKIDLCTWM